MRRWHKVLVIAPILFGAVASWSILKGIENPWVVWGTAVSGLLAGLFPAIFKALGLDGHIAEVSRQAGSFKNLQDKFRFLAESSHLIIDEERSVKFQQLMDEMNELRMHSRSEEHTSELQSLMRISYAVFCLKKKITTT